MFTPLSILIIGKNKDLLSPVVKLLEKQHRLLLATHVLGNGHTNPLLSKETMPDALVLVAGTDWNHSCQGLVDGLPPSRPPFVVVGPDNNMEFLRAAMRAGAREVFSVPFDAGEFLTAVSQIAMEERSRSGQPSARVIALMNAKGGSGASFLATNIASVLAGIKDSRTILVDMEFQFGGIPTYLNLPAKNGLIKALEMADSLDETALKSYVQSHESGLDLLAAAMDDIILPDDVSEHRVNQLLSVLDQVYGNIVIDLPHRIDAATAAVLAQADRIVLVTQQTVAHLQATKRLVQVLRDNLGVSPNVVMLVINRFSKKEEVRLQDFSNVFSDLEIEQVPGDFRQVAESINMGVPLSRGAPRSILGRRLSELAKALAKQAPETPSKSSGLFEWLRRPTNLMR